jgi:hypothetical protein
MGIYVILLITVIVAGLSVLAIWLENRPTKPKKRRKKKEW